MHKHASSKPIGKCHGCPMNLKKSCAVFSNPREQWSHGSKPCKGFMNQALYQHWLDEQMQKAPPETGKEARREKMDELKTVEHQDGMLTPSARRW